MDLAAIWPPYGLVITAGDLRLSIITDDDAPEFVDLVLDGVHDPDFMPFGVEWTDAPRDDLPANFVRFHWATRAAMTPKDWTLRFAVRRDGELVGTQDVGGKDFMIARTCSTGSWLGRRFHHQHIGTRMRQAVCAFAFDELGATRMTSGAFADNAPSLGVSRRLGYRTNGVDVVVRRGVPTEHRSLLLTADAFVRGADPITVRGAEAVRRFLEIEK
ncbi:GNAT family N-acetyltransferase [Microlunatus sp. Gsoil 973]|uniref:GNAT family N-acetyltransferase n=1 Tax=Microlunatus sp. Gsoil 973 TaxID=2672569 RepID=UPI0012B46A84|nr:GNAT family protein [Microlunatus sp. Gsoil 973]QGN33100.1 GNAT family N-acetyltransferase [Microlunatus sp. Gsoil 973]